jgi:molecular chaperone GrpE
VTRKRHEEIPAPAAGDAAAPPDTDEWVLDEAVPPDAAGGTEPPGPQDGVATAVVAAFEVELAEAMRRAGDAQRQADANWDLYLRAEADLENQRKRGERLREDAQARVRRDLLVRFLEVNDNLERALAYGDADPAHVLAGVEATYRELARLLTREGVQQVEALDAPFDPLVHEAVGVVPVPGLADERVIAVERPGYTLNGELLRPARVVVGQPA